MSEYRQAPGLNWSSLSVILQSPLAYKGELLRERDETPSMRLGTLIHQMVLEPERAIAEVPPEHLTPKGSLSTSAKTVEWLAAQPDSVYLPSEIAKARGLADVALRHPALSALLAQSIAREVPVFWEAGENECKGLPDLVTPSRVWDLKTTDPQGRAFDDKFLASFVANRQIHGQIAWYLRGMKAIGGSQTGIGVIVLNTKTGDVICRALDGWIDAGNKLVDEALMRYRDCTLVQSWPGYDLEIKDLPMPKWAAVDFDDNDDGGF